MSSARRGGVEKTNRYSQSSADMLVSICFMFSKILDVNMVYFGSLYGKQSGREFCSQISVLGSTTTCNANIWRDYVMRTGGTTAGSDICIPRARRLVGSLKQAVIATIKTPKTTTATPETQLLCPATLKKVNCISPAIQITDEILPCRSPPLSVSQEEEWSRPRNRVLGEAWCFHSAIIFQCSNLSIAPQRAANAVHWIGLFKFRSDGGGRGGMSAKSNVEMFLTIRARWVTAWRKPVSGLFGPVENQDLRRSSSFRSQVSTTPMTIPPSPAGKLVSTCTTPPLRDPGSGPSPGEEPLIK
jgi:hypothetical protein